MIRFGKTTFDDGIKNWSFARLKETYEGKLDYISLAKQLGIKEEKPKKEEVEKPSKKKAKESDATEEK